MEKIRAFRYTVSMNLQDRGLRAYQNMAKSDGERAKDGDARDRTLNAAFLSRLEKVPAPTAAGNGGRAEKQRPLYRGSTINSTVSDAIDRARAERTAAKALAQGGLLKVPARAADGTESVYRRVAKFLLLIGENEAAKIMPHLGEAQIEKIVPELASIRRVEPDEAAAILAEFQSLMQKAREDGGVETARAMLEKAFGAEKAAAVLQKSVPFADGKPFEYLAEADAEKVALLLRDEGGAVRALVLSHLPAKTAAAVITGLGDSERKDVVMRLARLKTVNPDVVRRVDAAMREKLSALAVEQSDGIDGRAALTQILKQLSPSDEEAILSRLSEQDPDLGADLRERLFTGDDVLRADDRYVQGLLRAMGDGELALLIAGKDDDFRRKILGNVSQNRAAIILDEEQARKPMRRGDCERVTSQFFSTLRRAWEDGVMVIKGRDDEIYV